MPDVSEKMDVAAVPFFTLHRVRAASLVETACCSCNTAVGDHGSVARCARSGALRHHMSIRHLWEASTMPLAGKRPNATARSRLRRTGSR